MSAADASADENNASTTKVGSGGESSSSLLTPEQQEDFDQCMSVLEDHKKHVPQVARAIATINREGYYASYQDGNFKNANDFIHNVFGFERSYIIRMNNFGQWLYENEIPLGKEPSETSVREMLQGNFTPEERRQIYCNAQKKYITRQKLRAEKKDRSDRATDLAKKIATNDDDEKNYLAPQSNDEIPDEIDTDIIPEAKDLRQAVAEFKEVCGKIYFPMLKNKSYPAGTSFSTILKENKELINNSNVLLGCLKTFRAGTNTPPMDEETAQAIRNHMDYLIAQTKKEMEDLIMNPSSAPETDEE